MQEIELKFQVPAARSAALHRAVATASARHMRLQAVYADTDDSRLAAAGLALRLRREDARWVQALKGRGDGLVQRLEHELVLPPQRGRPVIDPQRHAGTPAGAALAAALAGAGPLRPMFETDIVRTHRRVRHAGAVVEIAHDRGHIVAGSRRIEVDEIEFELISGPAAALAGLAARWAVRHGLWWDVRTKAERGFRLALGVAQVPPKKAAAVSWPATATPWQALQAMLRSALQQALPNLAEIAAGNGTPEHLHQLRVALRRLRTVLAVFAPWAAAPGGPAGGEAALAALRTAWREPWAALGAVRDADVWLQAWQPRLAAALAPPLEWPAAPAGADAGELSRASPLTVCLLQTLELVLKPGDRADAGAITAAQARSLLVGQLQRVRRHAKRRADAAPEQQHALRKRLKRLRYAIELARPLLKPARARRLLAALEPAVDALGTLQDLQVAEARFRALAAQQAAAWFGAGYAVGLREAAERRAAKRLLGLLRAGSI